MKVFASAIGQWDNVGDTVLRRGYLGALRAVGPLHVYIGGQTSDQQSALGLDDADVLIRSSTEWRSQLTGHLRSEPILYAFDTGESELRRRFALRYMRLAPLLVANRLRGGHAVHVGVGIRESTALRHPIAAALRSVDIVSWRDHYSRDVMGLGEVAPDWAFALGSANGVLCDDERARPLLAIAMRASLPHSPRVEPDDQWADRVRGIASELGLTPIFVAQIGRDGPLAHRLAARIGADALVWESGDHATFESRLRAVYRSSAVVVSDRLHGLVIGATEGALPVALSADARDKTVRTLDAAGILDVALNPDLDDGAARIASVLGRRTELIEAVISSRGRLTDLRDEIARLRDDAEGGFHE